MYTRKVWECLPFATTSLTIFVLEDKALSVSITVKQPEKECNWTKMYYFTFATTLPSSSPLPHTPCLRETGTKSPYLIKEAHLHLVFHFIYSGCEAKVSQKSELNHCTKNWEKTRKTVSLLNIKRRKTTKNYSRENPRSQVETEKPIHIMLPAGFKPGSQTWKARQDTNYANKLLSQTQIL